MTVLALDVARSLPPRRALLLLGRMTCILVSGAFPHYVPLQRQLHGLEYAAAVVADQLTARHHLCRAAL